MYQVVIVLLFTVIAACDRDSGSSASSPPQRQVATELAPGLTRVTDASQVCMMNDQFMGKPQIPVEVDGRTYYGCCAMCKERLHKEPATRTARDPASGDEVDKATALLVQDAKGKILYFASEDSLQKYVAARR